MLYQNQRNPSFRHQYVWAAGPCDRRWGGRRTSDQAPGKLGMQAGQLWWITRAQGRAAEIAPATNLEVALESQ